MELLVGMLAAWGLITLIWTLAGAILLPIRRRENLRLTVVFRGKAEQTQLEHWIRGLIWLRESGIWRTAMKLEYFSLKSTQIQH